MPIVHFCDLTARGRIKYVIAEQQRIQRTDNPTIAISYIAKRAGISLRYAQRLIAEMQLSKYCKGAE